MRFGAFFKKARLLETLLMTGFVLIAIPFLGELPSDQLPSKTLLLFAANFLLLIAVYSANSYFGYKADRINPRFKDGLFESPLHYLVVAATTLIGGVALLGIMNSRLPYLGVLSFLLWVFYSAPGGAKSRPVLGTLVHLVGQVLQFHLCVLAFTEPTLATLLISIYFGMLFASGHLMHEVKDHESDSLADIRTNSVTFGTAKVIAFYRVVVLVIPMYWLSLWASGFVALGQFLPFLIASVVHAGLTFVLEPGTEKYQTVYRILYFVAGVFAFATLFASNP